MSPLPTRVGRGLGRGALAREQPRAPAPAPQHFDFTDIGMYRQLAAVQQAPSAHAVAPHSSVHMLPWQ